LKFDGSGSFPVTTIEKAEEVAVPPPTFTTFTTTFKVEHEFDELVLLLEDEPAKLLALALELELVDVALAVELASAPEAELEPKAVLRLELVSVVLEATELTVLVCTSSARTMALAAKRIPAAKTPTIAIFRIVLTINFVCNFFDSLGNKM
jgi:hypothetical protein